VFKDIAENVDEEFGIVAVVIDFPNVFNLVPRDRLLTKPAASGVDSKVDILVM